VIRELSGRDERSRHLSAQHDEHAKRRCTIRIEHPHLEARELG
jgi:hypothetical protein